MAAPKVHSYRLGDGQVTFAMMNRTEADNYYNILKQKEEIVETTLNEVSYALGKTLNKATGMVTISVLQYDSITGKAKIMEQIICNKGKSNVEMRKLFVKYPLLD